MSQGLDQRQALRQGRRQDQRLRSRPALRRRRLRGHPHLRRQGLPPPRTHRSPLRKRPPHPSGNPAQPRADDAGRPRHGQGQRQAGRLHPPGGDARGRLRSASIRARCTDPQVIIIVDDISLYPPELYENGLEIITASTIRNHPNALNPRIKSLNYLNNILAKIEAIRAGCLEALMLNHKGEVAECTGDNIFLVKHGVLRTPPLDAGILEGITRNAVIELARAAKITGAGDGADAARRLHRRRVLPDRHGRRGHSRREMRRPAHRHRQARADHPATARAVPSTGSANNVILDSRRGESCIAKPDDERHHAGNERPRSWFSRFFTLQEEVSA